MKSAFLFSCPQGAMYSPHSKCSCWVYHLDFWPRYAVWWYFQLGDQLSKMTECYPFISKRIKKDKVLTCGNLLMTSVCSLCFFHSKPDINPFKVGSSLRGEEREPKPSWFHTCIRQWNLLPFHIRGVLKTFTATQSGHCQLAQVAL